MTGKITKQLLKELSPRKRAENEYLLRQYPELRLKKDSKGEIRILGLTKAFPELELLKRRRPT
jgi:hypothetical protein